MKSWPDGGRAIAQMDRAVRASALEPDLVELVKIRASQVNGCGFCLDIHVKDAHAIGVDQLKMDTLATWREVPYFTDRERAALAWTESMTNIAQTGVPDADWELVRTAFSEEEIVVLSLAIVAINAWNRFELGFRSPVGKYVSRRSPREEATPAPTE
jgi:AhpD family alkylhydroperoxidase